MYNINKKVLKALRRLAAELPPIKMVACVLNSEMKGDEVLLTGLKLNDGEEIDPEGDYTFKNPLIREVNHLLRLKKIYKKHGGYEVILYCENIKNQTDH